MSFLARRAVVGLAVVAVLAAAAVLLAPSEPKPVELPPAPNGPPPNQIVPDQFVARISTEALGRAPDQRIWQRATAFFHRNGCTAASLAGWARVVYDGDEFDALGYDEVERTLALYEGALARELDQPGLQAFVGAARQGTSWRTIVDQVLASDEFARTLAPAACAPASPAYATSLASVPLTVPTGGAGFTGDQAGLQARLDATPAGGVVALAPRAVVALSAPLRIPAGVTLTTTGDPGPERYARMGRLIRATAPAGDPQSTAVELAAGARLRGVWVDGGRAWLGTYVKGGVNVAIHGDGATVERSKLTNPIGGGNLWVTGPQYGVACKTANLRANLLTGYSSGHDDRTWADGISVACTGATVTGNAVVDPTDVGIIVYRAPGATQASRVEGNTVIAAGRSAFGALAVDPLFDAHQTFSFQGTSFRDNTIWTGERTHFDIGLALGTRPWFGDMADKGTGASFTDNRTGALAIRTNNPIAVSGMLDATVQGNVLRALPTEPTRCAPGPVASVSSGWASGSIQGPTQDVPLSGCIVPPDH